jgi:uncharacterized protein DUF5317
LKSPYLAALAVLLETAGMLALDPESHDLVRRILIVSGFAVAFVFALLNLHFWPMRLLALGLFLNLMAMLANGGLMPVTPDHAIDAGFGAEVSRLELGDAVPHSKDVLKDKKDTRLALLTDTLVMPDAVPGRAVASPGDVIVFAALVLAAVLSLCGLAGRIFGPRGATRAQLTGAHSADP